MSEKVKGLLNYMQEYVDACDLLSKQTKKIEILKQENRELKENIKGYEQERKILCKNLNQRHILNELEKWLEEEIKKRKNNNPVDPIQASEYYIRISLEATLDILKELKGDL